ncbi:MAG: glycosyltransferase family 39 protein [Minicystis sp.]
MKRLRFAVPALFLILVALFVGGVLRSAPPPLRSDDEVRIEPAQGELLGKWMALGPDGAGTGYRFEGGEIRETFGTFRYTGPDGRKVIELHHRDTVSAPARRTERFALKATTPGVSDALLDVLEKRLRENEAAYTWIEAGHPPPDILRRLPALQLPIAWLLLAQAPLWLILAYRSAWWLLGDLSRSARRAVLAAVAVAALARLVLAPLRLVMLYIGYQLTSQALALQPIPRYGAGVPAFHHLILRAFGPDHTTILRVHAVLGIAMVPLVAALAHAIYRRPRVTVAAAFLWALVPAFIAHDTSEAVTVPILLFALAGLVLLTEALTEARPVALTGAAALLGLAMIGRPELPMLAPLAAVAVAAALPDARRRWALPHVALLAVALAVLVTPHLAHVYASARLLASQDSLPMGRYAASFIRVGVLDPRLYPILLVPFVVLAVIPFGGKGEPRWWRSLLLLGVAAADFGITLVDLDPANILRVQVPGALFYALVAAAGIDKALSLPALETRARPPVLAAAIAGVLAISTVPCLPAAFQQTNEDEEESFLRAARAALPGDSHLLVRLGYGDIKSTLRGAPVHLYFPDYLFSPPGRDRAVRDIVEWERDPTHPDAYFYLGVRCYTPEHSFDTSRDWQSPPTVPMRPACRRILDAYAAETIVERDAPSHGDPVRTGYYGGDTTQPMRLALIKLKPRAN